MTQEASAAELGLSEIALGDVFSVERTFTADDVMAFARVSGDFSPLHVDADYARTTEFGECVVHGMLVASLFSQLVGMRIPGKHALYLGQDLTFRRPVLVGDTVRATAKVTAKSEAMRIITLATEVRASDDRIAVAGTARVKVRGQEATAQAPPQTVSPALTKTGRVALVTGASRGIGAEIARTLARKQYAVAVNYFRHADSAASVVAAIEQGGGTGLAVQADVRDPHHVQAMILSVCEKLGAPTVVINCAIGEFGQAPFQELTWDRFLDQLEYQTKAVIQVCQAVYPYMKASGGGAVVNILSQVSGGVPPARMADYVVAKHALQGLSKALASEWAEDGIRVNMVSPSLIPTELTQHYPERVFRMEAARTPLKRLAGPADVANAVAFLVGDEGSFLTGVNLFVTGGQVML